MRKPVSVTALVVLLGVLPAPSAAAYPDEPEKNATAVGYGGAVSTVDPNATAAGIAALEDGGNAVDAAIAASGVLGVSEPYSSGIGGGGFMLIYLAESEEVVVVDGREEAPEDPRFDEDVFLGDDGEPLPFFDERVSSGLSVGAPGTFATWVEALSEYGTFSLAEALQPGIDTAREGFVVDETFASQTAGNRDRFAQIVPTAELFLPGGEVPEVGSVFTNPDLADTYELLVDEGLAGFYTGELAADIAATVQDPLTTEDATLPWRPGLLTTDDLASYEVLRSEPTVTDYRGLEVYGMGPPSSGGLTIGETLNILEEYDDLGDLAPAEVFHRLFEATKLAYADRGAYMADGRPEYNYVPTDGLLSQKFARDRQARIDEQDAASAPVPPGNPCPEDGDPRCAPAPDAVDGEVRTGSTTHLVTADRFGNMVSYTLTIEQIGGSGLTVPGRGFLLNNELTDFSADPAAGGPNLPAPGKRPRSSMAPTIVLDDGDPFLAVGTPGGSTIITTVLGVLVDRLDRGFTLPEAVAAPRATQRNTEVVTAEQDFIDAFGQELEALGHRFEETGELGAVTALERASDETWLVAAEPERRGAGDAEGSCAGGPQFTDVSDDNVHRQMIWCASAGGITNGIQADPPLFAPARSVSRAQAASFVARSLAAAGYVLPPSDALPFDDVAADAVHADAIAALHAAGIVEGTSADHFAPDRSVARDQIASLLVRALEHALQIETAAEGPPPFDDVAASNVHAENIAVAAERGLVEGRPDGTFAPKAETRRGQMVSLLVRFADDLVTTR
jgi:gamma-glutamyltranspeptidase/glutathione hydrolase